MCITALSRIAAVALFLAVTVLVARWLDPAGQGDYVVGITLAALVVQIGNPGLHSSNTYLLAQDRAILPHLLANSLFASAILGGIAACATGAVLQFWGSSWAINPYSLWLGAAMAPARLFFVLGGSLLIGLNRLVLFNLFQVLSYFLVLGAIGLVTLSDASLARFLWATVLGWWVTAFLMALVLLRDSSWSLALSASLFKRSLGYALKAYAVCLLGFLVLRANIFILQSFKGSFEVGQFSIASQAIDILSLLPTAHALVLFPRLVQDGQNRWRLTRQSLVQTGVLVLVLCLGTAILVKPAILIVYGQKYLPAVSIVLWLLPAAFFYSLTSIVSQYLAAVGFPRSVLVVWVLALLLLALLSSILIPAYAAIGAAISLSCVYAIVFSLEVGLALVVRRGRVASERVICPAVARAA